MNRVDLPNAAWFKSSYSNGNGECVEVADCGAVVGVRDSKVSGGPVLTTATEGWRAFVTSVVAEELAPI